MNLNQLEYFCTAVECGSITKAAKKLFVTQPAISGAIRELEKEFAVTLFSHTRNKLTLSPDGERFYVRAKQLLREVEAAQLQLHDLGGSRQPVRVGIPPLWGTTFFPDLLRDFRQKYPDIRLTFTNTALPARPPWCRRRSWTSPWSTSASTTRRSSTPCISAGITM